MTIILIVGAVILFFIIRAGVSSGIRSAAADDAKFDSFVRQHSQSISERDAKAREHNARVDENIKKKLSEIK